MQIKKKHGGAQEESTSIKYHADKWCKDNGYPLQKRKKNLKAQGRTYLANGISLDVTDDLQG